MGTPPGWYDDGSGRQRWWNGTAWTEHAAGPNPTTGTLVIDREAFTPPPPHVMPAEPAPVPARMFNTVGLVSMILAIVGTVCAVIPGVMVVGWVLMPVSFVLAIVSLFLRGQRRGMGIAGLVVSVVGTIIGALVFFAMLTLVVSDADLDLPRQDTTFVSVE